MDKVTSVEVAELRRVFALKLLDLPVDEIREHLMQFHVDMMDYFEQGPNEKVFVAEIGRAHV